MSENTSDYHRTFLRLGGGGMPTPVELAKMSRNVAHRPVTVPQTSMGVPSGTTNDTRKFHQALKVEGSQLREIQIYEKSDQKFEQFATPWERKWSRLISHDTSRLSPVVDGNMAAVGYYGVVRKSEILISLATGLALIYTPEETLKYHRMFVGDRTLHSGAGLDLYGNSPFLFYAVLTDIYGEVTSFEFAYKSRNGQVQSTDFPGLGWLKSGLKILISLKNGLRTLGRQPALPPPAPQRALPPGQSEPLSGGVPVRKGSQTIVSQGAATPVPRPRQVFDTGLGEAVQNVRRHLGLPPLPARTVSELHAISRGRRADKDLDEWLRANPNASWPEKAEVMNRIYARWRVQGMPGEE